MITYTLSKINILLLIHAHKRDFSRDTAKCIRL